MRARTWVSTPLIEAWLCLGDPFVDPWLQAPRKSRAQVLLEYARLEEYLGNMDAARHTLTEARTKARGDWKVFLEAVLFERRNGDRGQAVRAVRFQFLFCIVASKWVGGWGGCELVDACACRGWGWVGWRMLPLCAVWFL
jgi:hypothetical protein